MKHLARIINGSLRLAYSPCLSRESTTVVLRKLGKDNYTVPKAHEPIALLNTANRVMSAIISRRLSHLVETQHVLPDTHMDDMRMRSSKHPPHAVIRMIYQTWKKGDRQIAVYCCSMSQASSTISRTYDCSTTCGSKE